MAGRGPHRAHGRALGLVVLALWSACGEEPRSREISIRELRPVRLPALDGHSESVRRQLEAQYAELQVILDERRAGAPRLAEEYGRIGQLLLAYEFMEAAGAPLRNAADLAPGDPRWPYYLGYLAKLEGRWADAAARFEGVLELAPEDVPSHLHLAEAYMQQGREQDARAVLENAVRVDSTSAAAHFLLAQIAGLDDPDEAIARYEAVLRHQPDASVVHYPLALAYGRRGDTARSREHMARRGDTWISVQDPLLEVLQRLRRGTEARIVRATGLMRSGRYREAADLLEEVVAEDSLSPIAYLNLGASYARLGRSEEARAALRRALELDPGSSRAHHNLGLLFGMAGTPDSALHHLRAAVELDPANRDARFALANLLAGRGECDEAIPHFREVLDSRPEHASARRGLAVCYTRSGRDAEARDLLEAGLKAAPDEPVFREALARILAASRDPAVRDGARALELAQGLVNGSRSAERLAVLAMAYAAVGRFDAAVEAQQTALRAAERAGATDRLEGLRRDLRRYRQGESARSPWPAAAPSSGSSWP